MINKHADPCPHCQYDMDAGDIYEKMLEIYKDDPEYATEAAGHYGWTPETPKRFSQKIGQYDIDRDITTHFECPHCHGWIER